MAARSSSTSGAALRPALNRILLSASAPFAASVICIVYYKYALRAWFQEDDFAWLGLTLTIHSGSDLWHALFAPMAQGTIRPISERAFFMLFYSAFGLNALPYRIAVVATQVANIFLLSAISRRVTGSQWAAFIAPIIWIANIGLAKPMTWTSAYNEILCAFVFLLSFFFLLRYIETGEPRFNRWQWATFLAGFGVLEINVVYPIIAIGYVALFARGLTKTMSWMLLPSIGFGLVRAVVVRNAIQRTSIYDLHLDPWSLSSTFAAYCRLALGSRTLAIVLSIAILGFAAAQIRQRNMLPLFCLGWFVVALAPFVPVRDHVTDYYLTVPSIGLALLSAAAVGFAANSNLVAKAAVYAALASYLAISAPATFAAHRKIAESSQPVKRLVRAVAQAHQQTPDQLLLLDGIDDATFWNCIYDHPFRLLGIDNAYLTPATVDRLVPYPELGNIADYILPQSAMLAALSRNRARVFSVDDGNLRDVTALFAQAVLHHRTPIRIDMSHPAIGTTLGPTWYPAEGDVRWMPKTATARLGAPEPGSGILRIEATCAAIPNDSRPLLVTVTANGLNLPPVTVDHCGDRLRDLRFPLDKLPPASDALLNIVIELDRTMRVPPDQRDLGLAVRTIEVINQR